MKEYLFVAFAQSHMTYYEVVYLENEEEKITKLSQFYDDFIDSKKADYVVCLEEKDVHALCKTRED